MKKLVASRKEGRKKKRKIKGKRKKKTSRPAKKVDVTGRFQSLSFGPPMRMPLSKRRCSRYLGGTDGIASSNYELVYFGCQVKVPIESVR